MYRKQIRGEDSTQKESLYYGVHICRAICDRRPDDVVRVYIMERLVPQFRDILKDLAQRKKVYRVVDAEEMEKVTGSKHHEGVAMIVVAPSAGTFKDLQDNLDLTTEEPVLFIDGVENPHNIGIIMRGMAHYGWKYLAGDQYLPDVNSSSARMSEGGSEFVALYRIADLDGFFKWFKQNGYKVIGTSSHSDKSIKDFEMPKKVLFILGSETHGISRDVEKYIDINLLIPGTGNVESLNVSVAGGVIMNEYYRKYC